MAFEIRLSNDAKRDIQSLRVVDRRKVLDALEIHLRYAPKQESKSRIKRLRRMETPQYRLRVDDLRIYYDVIGHAVEVIAVVHKAFAAEWLTREGILAHEHEPQGEDTEDASHEND